MAESPPLLNRLAAGTRYLGLGLIGLGVLTVLAPAVSGGAVVVVVGLLLLAGGVVLAVFGAHLVGRQGGLWLRRGRSHSRLRSGARREPGLQSLARDDARGRVLRGRGHFPVDLRPAVLGGGRPGMGVGRCTVMVSAGAVMVRVARALRRVGDGVENLRARLGVRRPFDRDG